VVAAIERRADVPSVLSPGRVVAPPLPVLLHVLEGPELVEDASQLLAEVLLLLLHLLLKVRLLPVPTTSPRNRVKSLSAVSRD